MAIRPGGGNPPAPTTMPAAPVSRSKLMTRGFVSTR